MAIAKIKETATGASAAPFLRWAGSKRRLVPRLRSLAPQGYETYFEPFLGSGSLFFALQPNSAVLGDSLEPLIATYTAVRDRPEEVIVAALSHAMTSEYYYENRRTDYNDLALDAGAFIYRNHACFNGLYRVNLKGEFNVPWGRPKTNFIVDPENIRACSKVLRKTGVTISCQDFEATLQTAGERSFVYLDPPYVTGHNNNGFIEYNEKIFSWADQVRLATRARQIVGEGGCVLVSNADHEAILDLYQDFEVVRVSRHSGIAGAAHLRSEITEVILIGRGF